MKKLNRSEKRKIARAVVLAAAILVMVVSSLSGCGESPAGINEASDNEAEYYTFRYDDLLQQHYEKHGAEMGFESAEEYEQAANAVISNPDALTKTEAEDGDYIYYVEQTNEFVVLSTDGYIRTYFNPYAGKDYFERQ